MPMKTLYLLRHAKSSWNYPELDDFERPLNKRGRGDLPVMAKVIKHHGIKPDLIISSPALRASFTALNIIQMAGIPENLLSYDNLIYEASTSMLLNIIKGTSAKVNTLMIVGHNPGLTTLANYLSDKYVDNIPTCGLFALKIDIKQWQELYEKSATFLFFEYPKLHQRS
jgi:phosphohistidine phosphatase